MSHYLITSSILERVILANVAVGMVARHETGQNHMADEITQAITQISIPRAGSHPRFTLKVITSIIPNQKIGMDTPTSARIMNT